MISIGARDGNVPASDVLPHPTTVSGKVADVDTVMRNAMRNTIEAAMKQSRVVTNDVDRRL